MKKSWLQTINQNLNCDREHQIAVIYKHLLQWLVEEEYRGGCHDTSAIFHILLKEKGIENKLCIGEVKTDEYFFDHSWVEINNKIYDFAICMPLKGIQYHPPIFGTIDLETKKETTLIYAISTLNGLDEPARTLSKITLYEYALNDPKMPNRLWFMVEQFAAELGEETIATKLINKYGQTRRELRRHVDLQ